MSTPRALIRAIPRPIKRLFEKQLDARIRSTLRLTPITETAEEDVFIVGYPKSGNTWFQNLVAGVIYGVDPEYAPDTLVQELVPDVHYKRCYKRFGTPMFFKSHHLPRPDYRRVVYLLRDGRDVMVSYYHHNKALRGDNFDFLNMVRDGDGLVPCKWHVHVKAWLTNPYNANMVIIKYEELKSNPLPALQRFCKFVGIDRDDNVLQEVAMKASFSRMRSKEIQCGWDTPEWPKDKHFVRRGVVGSYKDEMPRDLLELFLEEAGEMLQKSGYLIE